MDLLFWEERMQAVSDELIGRTDDSPYGREALVIVGEPGIPVVLGIGVATERRPFGQTIAWTAMAGQSRFWIKG
jgi:hypothetical protein